MVFKINFKIIIKILGLLLVFNGGLMLTAVLVSFIMQDGVSSALILSSFSVITLGGIMALSFRNSDTLIHKREGYLIVVLGWLLMSITGMFPYLFSGVIINFSSAFFETLSGYTTTGATILEDIETLPAGVLFWRSMTHWIGGMGIIVLAIAILPFLGIGGMQLFSAESPGPGSDKLHPRITDTAKRLWLIYFIYTVSETILLKFAGMSLFDAVNHSMSTLSTGGFSTKNDSIAYWNDQPVIQYIIMFFMFLAGSNFVLSYFAFKGKFARIFMDNEFKMYVSLIFFFTLIVSLILLIDLDLKSSTLFNSEVFGSIESSFRHGIFQVLSIVTTTGFITADFTAWTPFLTLFFFGLMFLGGSAGSTSGGVKVVRHLLMIKSGILEFKRALHPNAIIQTRYNNRIVGEAIVYNIVGFFILYLLSFIIGALVFALIGLDFESAIGVSAATLGNIGPALGDFGPLYNYSKLSDFGLWWASFLMLIGRLELFTVLILFTPFFWRSR